MVTIISLIIAILCFMSAANEYSRDALRAAVFFVFGGFALFTFFMSIV